MPLAIAQSSAVRPPLFRRIVGRPANTASISAIVTWWPPSQPSCPLTNPPRFSCPHPTRSVRCGQDPGCWPRRPTRRFGSGGPATACFIRCGTDEWGSGCRAVIQAAFTSDRSKVFGSGEKTDFAAPPGQGGCAGHERPKWGDPYLAIRAGPLVGRARKQRRGHLRSTARPGLHVPARQLRTDPEPCGGAGPRALASAPNLGS